MGKPKKRRSEDAAPEAEADEPGAEPSSVPPAADAPSEEAPAAWLAKLSELASTDRMGTIIVLVLGFFIFIPFLGTLGLWDPWETHYGEVAREMIARDDFVYPHWESAYFFSKPAFPLWLMAFGMLAFGADAGPVGDPLGTWVEWGVRLPFALIAIWAMWAVYRIGRQLRDRNTGLLAAFVLGSCPQFIFIGKQAMTDMPLVGLMTVGLALFIAAVFDEEDNAPADTQLKVLTMTGFGAALFIQLFLIGREVQGVMMAGMVILGIAGAGLLAWIFLQATRRDCWLIGFYALAGLAALSKGLAVLAVVGPVVVFYCLFSGDWDLLRRSKFYVWGAVFLMVASPWYVVLSMFGGRDDEGLTFVQRFWAHDNFNRVGAGVHGDRAGLGYYIEQLGYGMFPWAAAIPFAVGGAIRAAQEKVRPQKARAVLFVLVWAMWVYAFFTMSQTKFHHYIFPAVPAFALLVALWFRWVADAPKSRLPRVTAVVLLLLLAVIARDVLVDPKSLVNLFTYKYDRDYPREIQPHWPMAIVFAIGGASMAYTYAKRQVGQTLIGFFLLAALFGAWISHHHFNMLSPHWSQYHLFDTYYAEKKPGEPIYAYQLNWRGETFYSRNTVLQVKESGANQRIRRLVDQPGREFIVTEQSRFHTLKSALSPDKQDKLQIIDRSNNKFYLCLVED